MGLSRMQGTSGYIGYYNEDHGKLTRRSCRHYNREARWCMKSGKRKACKNPTTCVDHSEQTHTYLKPRKSKKQRKQCKECCFCGHRGMCLADAEQYLVYKLNCAHFIKKPDHQRVVEGQEKNDIVTIGWDIKLLNMTKKLILDIQLVIAPHENKYENKISIDSLLGRAILNQTVGDVVKVKGETYKILKISKRKKKDFVEKG